MGEAFIVRRGGGGVDVLYESVTIPAELDFNFSFVNQSSTTFNPPAYRIVSEDNDFIYVANGASSGSPRNNRFNKLYKSNLTFVTSSSNLDGQFLAIAEDTDSVYAGGYTNLLKPYRFFKSNLVVAAIGNTNYGDWIEDLAVDDSFVYCVGLVASNIRKYHKGNLVSVGTSPSYGNWLFAVEVDDSFVYIGGMSPSDIKKYHKGNLGFVGATNGLGGNVASIQVDDTYVYAVSRVTNLPMKRWFKSNLAFAGETNSFNRGLGHDTLKVDDLFVYVTSYDSGTTNERINRFYKENLVFVNKSDTVGNATQLGASIGIDNNFVYAATAGTVKKYSKITEVSPEITDEVGKVTINNISYIKEDLVL